MSQARRHFHDELAQLERDVLTLGAVATQAVARAAQVLERSDVALSEQVIAADDEVDQLYIEIDKRTLELLALQTPVAVDLRLISAILHINVHLERVGDLAVNIAKIVKSIHREPANARIMAHLLEMADVVGRMLRAAMESFAQRDLDIALKLPEMDEPVDRLNRGMYAEVVTACTGDPDLLEWALRMMMVSRQLERAGDHAVDIGEQVAFLLTGEFREFTDASHPVVIDERGI